MYSYVILYIVHAESGKVLNTTESNRTAQHGKAFGITLKYNLS